MIPAIRLCPARIELNPFASWPAAERFVSRTTVTVNHPLTTEDDVELLRRVGQRDRQAFAQFYDRYSSVLFTTALRVLNDQEEASDVLQEIFIQIWDKAASYDPALGKPFSWVLTMARNRAIDRLRSLQRRYRFLEEVTHELDAPAEQASAGDDVFGREKAVLIRAAVEALPLEQRQAIELAFLGGLTQFEIAETLQQPLGTIKARIRRGLLKLRERLKGLS